MSVFLPAAFVPGLTGQMFAQFALVIAATALISAVNAATLKPTQCALWLRPTVPPEQRNFFFRGFNKVYGKLEDAYAWLIGAMVHPQRCDHDRPARRRRRHRRLRRSRIPTSFLPVEDQGYMLVVMQLPDGASLERTDAVAR